MPQREERFEQRLKRALESPEIATALGRALGTFGQRRAVAFEDLDFAALRADLVARKSRAIDGLPELVERFTREAEKTGSVVHMARTAEDARQVIADLLHERGAKLVVKGKSMVTEEIGLNDFLADQGVKVVETDLGEWIIQLAGEHPSHLIAPAIHKTREEVAQLFRRELGVSVTAETRELVAVARRHLRQSFIDADVGISGANVAIADSGTLVLVSNEGNGRLVTSLPPVHIAVVGIEKIVPSLDDAVAVLKVLAPSATGQKASSYVSFITGPSRTADIELDLTTGVHGPREVHIVLVDNGRSATRKDDGLRDALRCIRCAACANVCPSYRVVGGTAFGDIYTGPIGLVLTAVHQGLDRAAGPQSLCLSCNACETVCPAGIDIPRLILEVRRRVVTRNGTPLLKRAAFSQMAKPADFRRLVSVARAGQRLMAGGLGRLTLLNESLAWRRMPRINKRSLSERLSDRVEIHGKEPVILDSKAAGKTVAYFAGCITDLAYPEMGEALIRVLEACGVRVVFVREQTCCGLPAINSGDSEIAGRMARKTIEALEAISADYVVSGSPSCVVAMRDDYPRILAGDADWTERATQLGRRVVDFVSFMERVAQLPAEALASGKTGMVSYHDSCQSHNCIGLKNEPRRLIREVLGMEIVEMAESDVCCGFGGAFSFEHPKVARQIADRKLARIKETRTGMVVTDNPGCIMHLRGIIDAQAAGGKVVHLAELMAEKLLYGKQGLR